MSSTRERGRPRAFNKDCALQKAIEVFTAKGYEATSLEDLTQAMGINKPSLYAAFGNKDALFLQALEAYTAPQDQIIKDKLFAEANTYRAFEQVFELIYQNHTHQSACGQNMNGCLVANSTMLNCEEKKAFAEALQRNHNLHEDIFFERLEQGRQHGDLKPDTDSRALAQFFNGILVGIAVLARGQQKPEALCNIVNLALQTLKSHTC